MARDELVAIVDEFDRPVGSAPRHRMRSDNLLHRATYVLVFDAAGRLYVQKRTTTKDIFPGYWDPCTGGVVLAGESYEESAARELEEEMGIRGVEIEPLFVVYYEDPRSRVFGRAFQCRYDGELTLQAEEVESVERMTPHEVLARASNEPFTADGLIVVRRWLGQ